MPTETIHFHRGHGPVAIEVMSGYATLGSFVLAYKRQGDALYHEFGKDPKRIDDDVPDLFLLPVDVEELDQYHLVIMGKYAPAPDHTQIRVDYLFVQQAEIIHRTCIAEAAEQPFLRFNHRYVFQPAAADADAEEDLHA